MPLTREQFRSAIEKGLGRALLHVRAAGLADVEDLFIDACLHHKAYDAQCEGERAPWLMQIFDAGGAEARIAQQVTSQLGQPTDQYWDAVHRCQMARELARRGCAEARERLYANLRKWPTFGNLIAADEIVELDGAAGLVHVAEFQGRLCESNPEFSACDNVILVFESVHGKESARRVLDAASATSPDVAAYLKHLDAQEAERRASVEAARQSDAAASGDRQMVASRSGPSFRGVRMRQVTAADVIRQIEQEDPQHRGFWCRQWGRCARADQLPPVFERLVSESDPIRLAKFLRVFSIRALDNFDARLLPLASHADREVRTRAIVALSNYQHPEVRRLAIERIGAGRLAESELTLLNKNYQPGDAALIERSIQGPFNVDDLHGVMLDATELFGLHPLAESAAIMLLANEKTPCAMCRYHAVKNLLAAGTAPEWLIDECRFDSYDETRDLAAANAPTGPLD